jgi:hypothetical protein
MSADTQWLDAAMSKYVTGQLARFRAEVENRTHQSIGSIQTDAARLLSDLCRHFGLDEEQHAHVLGESGVRHVEERYLRRRRQRALSAHHADLAASANSEMPAS